MQGDERNMQGEQKERFVHAVFESIAGHYDTMNDVLSFRRHKAWRKFAMKKMDVKPGDHAIDICCGTCDWTISIAKASSSGDVVGLDFSQNMLDIGQQKINRLELDRQIRLINGNAMALPYADHQFHYATIGFALRNVPDIRQVLREMKRVVKPGGWVVSLELSKPASGWFRKLYYFYFQRILPLLGKWLVKSYEQYRWLPESLIQFPDYQELAQWFREEGLEDVRVYPLNFGIAALHMGRKPIREAEGAE